MKKLCFSLLCLVLAAALTVSSFASIDISSYKSKDGETLYYDEDAFSIDPPSETLRPGVDYYFEAFWGTSPMDSEFFDDYILSQSYVSDTDGVSNTAFGKYIAVAEFTKGKDGGYYYHVRVNSSRSLNDDIDGAIVIYAKDRLNSDDRAATVLELTIGYGSVELTVDDDECDLPDGGAVVEFEKGNKSCLVTFYNNSTLDLKLSSTHKYNFSYAEDVSASVAAANPAADLQQMTFYGRPVLAERSKFRFYAGSGARYLYELGTDNTLTQIGTKNADADGFFTFWTDRLGTYIASDLPLKNTAVGNTASTAANTAAAQQPAAQTSAAAEGWYRQADGTMLYRYGNGSRIQNGWASIGGEWYCFDQNGVLRTNQWIRNTANDRIWYYVDENGEMVKNRYVGQFYLNARGEYYGA